MYWACSAKSTCCCQESCSEQLFVLSKYFNPMIHCCVVSHGRHVVWTGGYLVECRSLALTKASIFWTVLCCRIITPSSSATVAIYGVTLPPLHPDLTTSAIAAIAAIPTVASYCRAVLLWPGTWQCGRKVLLSNILTEYLTHKRQS